MSVEEFSDELTLASEGEGFVTVVTATGILPTGGVMVGVLFLLDGEETGETLAEAGGVPLRMLSEGVKRAPVAPTWLLYPFINAMAFMRALGL